MSRKKIVDNAIQILESDFYRYGNYDHCNVSSTNQQAFVVSGLSGLLYLGATGIPDFNKSTYQIRIKKELRNYGITASELAYGAYMMSGMCLYVVPDDWSRKAAEAAYRRLLSSMPNDISRMHWLLNQFRNPITSKDVKAWK